MILMLQIRFLLSISSLLPLLSISFRLMKIDGTRHWKNWIDGTRQRLDLNPRPPDLIHDELDHRTMVPWSCVLNLFIQDFFKSNPYIYLLFSNIELGFNFPAIEMSIYTANEKLTKVFMLLLASYDAFSIRLVAETAVRKIEFSLELVTFQVQIWCSLEMVLYFNLFKRYFEILFLDCLFSWLICHWMFLDKYYSWHNKYPKYFYIFQEEGVVSISSHLEVRGDLSKPCLGLNYLGTKM